MYNSPCFKKKQSSWFFILLYIVLIFRILLVRLFPTKVQFIPFFNMLNQINSFAKGEI